jgi:hydrogenase maturation protease
MSSLPNVLILGIGNLLWADEGFGVRALEALQRHYRFPENVRLMDGGTRHGGDVGRLSPASAPGWRTAG